jgi:hypothetical protein
MSARLHGIGGADVIQFSQNGGDPVPLSDLLGDNGADYINHTPAGGAPIPLSDLFDDNSASLISFTQDAPLAQSIPLSEDLGLFTHPFRFGAVGDGVTDDRVALQRCLNYAMTVGAEVNLYNKLYACSGKLFVNGAQPINWHDGTIKAIGTTWGVEGAASGALVEVQRPSGTQRRHKILGINLDCNYVARTGWYLYRVGSGTTFINNHARRFLDYGHWAKSYDDGNNDVTLTNCTAAEATFNDEPKYSDYSLRTGVAFYLEDTADTTLLGCVGSSSKHALKIVGGGPNGTMFNFNIIGGNYWNGNARTDTTSVTVLVEAEVHNGQFNGCRFDDGAVKLYSFDHQFNGCKFIQFAHNQLQLVATEVGETAAELSVVGNTFSGDATPVALLTEGSGTWGEVSANWAGNKNMDGSFVSIQGKTLITNGLTIENGNVNLSGELQIDGVKVLGNRITGYGDFTNGAKTGFDATTATLPEVAAAVAQLITDFKTQGSIGA